MSRPVPLFPSLPRSPNAPVLDQMVQFDADLTRSLFLYLSDLARRANDALTVDGESPMEGDLDLGGNDIINVSSLTLLSTDGGAAAAPIITLDRDSPSPAANDVLGSIDFRGNSSTLVNRTYGLVAGVLISPTNGAEVGALYLQVLVNGVGTNIARVVGTDSAFELLTGHLKFPAAANPSADPNTLDDYERGTWTPSYTPSTGAFGSIAYGTRTGVYVKIGGLVWYKYGLSTTSITMGTAGGTISVTGLPFTSGASIYNGVPFWANGFTGDPWPVALQIHGSTAIQVYLGTVADGVTASFPTANMALGAGNQSYSSGSYEV